MPSYSKYSLRLAKDLAQTAADSLRRAGHAVTKDSRTGRHRVDPPVDESSRGRTGLRGGDLAELRRLSYPGLSEGVSERIWEALDRHPGFPKLPIAAQRRGFQKLVDHIFEGDGPASDEEVSEWRQAVYRDLGLRPVK